MIHGHPVYINIALHYIRPKQTVHVRETLQPLIRDVLSAEDLDLEADPRQVGPSVNTDFRKLTRTFLDISRSDRRRGNALWKSDLKIKGHLFR